MVRYQVSIALKYYITLSRISFYLYNNLTTIITNGLTQFKDTMDSALS